MDAASYDKEGFVGGIDIFSAEEIAVYRSKFDELEERLGKETTAIGLVSRHFEYEFIWQLASDERIVSAIASLIGDDVMLLATHFFCKYPGGAEAEKFVAWHQDVTYWGLEPPFAVNAWIAIDDSDADNGCVQFVPRSHKWGLREHGKADEVGNLLSLNQQVPMSEEESSQVVDNELKAGQISIHHGMMAHGSRPNRSTRRRCGMAMIYVPASSRPAEIAKGQWKVVPVRGEVNECHFEQMPRPFP